MPEIEMKQKVQVAKCANDKCKNDQFFAYYNGDRTVLYCGKCSTGFTLNQKEEEN